MVSRHLTSHNMYVVVPLIPLAQQSMTSGMLPGWESNKYSTLSLIDIPELC